jgi:hypothetical protein
MDPELTVRGRLHWVSVMKDWEWESKFNPFHLFSFLLFRMPSYLIHPVTIYNPI